MESTWGVLCEHQDPQTQGCTTDAQSVEVQDVFFRGMLIGEVDLRYSFLCQSFWTRTIASARAEGIIQVVHAHVTFNDATTQDRQASPNMLAARAPVISLPTPWDYPLPTSVVRVSTHGRALYQSGPDRPGM